MALPLAWGFMQGGLVIDRWSDAIGVRQLELGSRLDVRRDLREFKVSPDFRYGKELFAYGAQAMSFGSFR